jgi:pimeloyl-ACP methyl ester carboxylesterase
MIYYNEGISPKKKNPIIFIHGAWHGAWCWNNFMEKFSNNGYDCYSFDLRKHDSPGPKRKNNLISLDNYVKDLQDVINQVQGSPILIGHSMGGAIIQRFLKKNTCAKVIFLASCPPRGNWHSNFLNPIIWKRIPSTIFSGIKSGKFAELFEIVKKSEDIKSLFYSPNIDQSVIDLSQENLCSESLFAVIGFMMPLYKPPEISIPLLIVGGEDDPLILKNDLRNLHKIYKGKMKIFDSISHNMMLDSNHNIVSNYILDWLSD